MVTQLYDGFYFDMHWCKGKRNKAYPVNIGRNVNKWELHKAKKVNVEFDICGATITEIISYATKYLAEEILETLENEDIQYEKERQMRFELGVFREEEKAKHYQLV